jgi:hypothetical protein
MLMQRSMVALDGSGHGEQGLELASDTRSTPRRAGLERRQ